jgi:acyl carrier protein
MATEEIIKQISAMINRLEPDLNVAITVGTTFEDLGFDSLQKVDLLTEAEDTFRIKVSDDDLAEIVKVGDLIDFVADRVS